MIYFPKFQLQFYNLYDLVLTVASAMVLLRVIKKTIRAVRITVPGSTLPVSISTSKKLRELKLIIRPEIGDGNSFCCKDHDRMVKYSPCNASIYKRGLTLSETKLFNSLQQP